MPNVVIAAKTRVADEGSLVTNNPLILDFVGAGVTASQVGSSTQISIPGPTPIGPEGLVTFGPVGSGADYEADGTADDVEWALLQADSRLATGGTVMILDGTYNWTAGVAPDFRNSSANPLRIICRRGGVALNFNKSGAASLFWGQYHEGLTIVNGAAGQGQPTYPAILTVFENCDIGDHIQVSGAATAHFRNSTFGTLGAVNTVGAGQSWFIENCTVNNMYLNTGANVVAIKSTFSPGVALSLLSAVNGGVAFIGCTIPAWTPSTGTWSNAVIVGCNLSTLPPAVITGQIKGNTPNQYNKDYYNHGNATGAVAIDWSKGRTQRITLTGNTTLSFSGLAPGDRASLIIIQDGAGGWGITWPGAVLWPGGIPIILTGVAGSRDIVEIIVDDSGNYLTKTYGLNF